MDLNLIVQTPGNIYMWSKLFHFPRSTMRESTQDQAQGDENKTTIGHYILQYSRVTEVKPEFARCEVYSSWLCGIVEQR